MRKDSIFSLLRPIYQRTLSFVDKHTMNQTQLIRQIIMEEVGGLADETFKNDQTIPGTLSVRRDNPEHQLEPPSSVEAEEVEAADLAGTVLEPKNHLPDELQELPETMDELAELSRAISHRLGIDYRSHIFRSTHVAKMRIKELRELGAEVDLSSLRHGVVTEFVNMVNEHLQALTEAEKQIIEDLSGIVVYDKNAKPRQILASATQHVIDQAQEVYEQNITEFYDSESIGEKVGLFVETVLEPFLEYLKGIEINTRLQFFG